MPETFAGRDIYVWSYECVDLSPWAKRALAKEQKSREDVSISAYGDVPDVKPGSIILDFTVTLTKDKRKIDNIVFGVFKILSEKPVVSGDKGSISLCTKVNRIADLKIGDGRVWRSAARRAIQKSLTEKVQKSTSATHLQTSRQDILKNLSNASLCYNLSGSSFASGPRASCGSPAWPSGESGRPRRSAPS